MLSRGCSGEKESGRCRLGGKAPQLCRCCRCNLCGESAAVGQLPAVLEGLRCSPAGAASLPGRLEHVPGGVLWKGFAFRQGCEAAHLGTCPTWRVRA